MIGWLRKPPSQPAEPTPEDCAWAVVEALLLEHPEDWKTSNSVILVNDKTNIHIWTGNGVNYVRVALTHSECCTGGPKTEPSAEWKKKIWAACQRIISPEAPEVVKIIHLETMVKKVKDAYAPISI